jgi:hypothetical protein
MFLLSSALGLLACSSSGAEPFGSQEQAAATPFANDQKAFDYFLGKGLTNFQAAAVVGNLDQESGIDPTIHQNNGGVGRGIAQWSAGARWDTTPGDNVLEYAKQQGKSELSLDLQLDFVWFELNKFSNYGLAELKASSNVTDATQVFEDKFEGCVYANYPECALPSRVNFAKGVLAAYGNDVVAPSGGAGGMGGAAGNGSGGGGGGSGGAETGGSGGAGAAAGGAATAGAAVGGTPSAGAPTTAGAPASGGQTTTGTGGLVSTAGAPATAGAAGTPTFGAATSNDSGGCSISAPRSSSRAAWLLSIALGFAAARRKRRR